MPKANTVTRFIHDVPLEYLTISKIEKLYADTIRVNECRLRLNPHHTGYSYSRIGSKRLAAHRILKLASIGISNSDGLVVDHLCRNRSCIRLSHLELVTESENVRRGEAWLHFTNRTHCRHGHEFNEENTRSYIRKDTRPGTTRRICKECHKLTERRRRKNAKENRI